MQMQRMYSHGSRALQIVMSDDKLSASHKYNAEYLQKLCKGCVFKSVTRDESWPVESPSRLSRAFAWERVQC